MARHARVQDPGPRGARQVYPPAYLLLAAMTMIGLHMLAPVRQVIVGPFRLLGILLLGAGLALALGAAGRFRWAGTTLRPFERSTALVVEGPYRLTRNPIYLGMVSGLLGIGVMAGSITPFLVVPAFWYLIDRRFIRAEEASLEDAFGPQYLAYRSRVRRWL